MVGLVLAAAASACGSSEAPAPKRVVVESEKPPAVARVDGAPSAGDEAAHTAIDLPASATTLSLLAGAVAIGTSEGLYLGTTSLDDAVTAVPVVAEDDAPLETGPIVAMARRSGGRLLVAAEHGLFHDFEKSLLSSPLGEALDVREIATLDAFGEGDDEELWIALRGGTLLHVDAETITPLSIEGAPAAPTAAAAVGRGAALVAAGGTAYLIDALALTGSVVAEGLGAAHDFDRADDGTVLVATDAGLLSRARSGDVALRTFADPGAAGERVVAVAGSYGSVFAVTRHGLVAIAGGETRVVGAASGEAGASATVDANGDAWLAEGGELFRFQTGEPVSFEQDVRPFFAAHCTTCHATGENAAPVLDLEDYEVAKERAEAILDRLQAVDTAPMPPANVEVLTAEDYAVVSRWVGGGLLP